MKTSSKSRKKKKFKLENDEVDQIALNLIQLRQSNQSTLTQNFCINKLKFLVSSCAGRYKQFPNFPDLEQEGFEALLLSLATYDKNKGSFSWWATRYIKTRLHRSASAHSAIKIPIKKARELQPLKLPHVPELIDLSFNPLFEMQEREVKEKIIEILKQLPELHRNIVLLTFGCDESVSHVMKLLKVTRPAFHKAMNEIKEIFKEKLTYLLQ